MSDIYKLAKKSCIITRDIIDFYYKLMTVAFRVLWVDAALSIIELNVVDQILLDRFGGKTIKKAFNAESKGF